MSGAAALSAAKRRRGSSVQPPPAPPGGYRGVPRPQVRQTQQQMQPRPPAPTPMMLLQNHHERLASLESDHANTVNQLNSIQTNTGSEENKDKSEMTENIMKLQAKVDVLEEQFNKTPEKPIEDINYFKTKVSEMELQMAELKQHLLKIQNFAMETNLSLMKAKQADKSTEIDSEPTFTKEPEAEQEAEEEED